jgi:DNA-binding LacI/PurR family transcriptional regulator
MRVEAAIQELRYRPNVSAPAAQARAGRVPRAGGAEMESPYFAEVAAKISAEAIDGLIFSPLALSADEIADRNDDLPMVLLGERAVPPGHDHVAVDSVAAARAPTEHLVAPPRGGSPTRR